VAELALDNYERHAFVGHLDGVGVAELMGREGKAAGVDKVISWAMSSRW
jgi:hypothetical protein